MSDELTITTLAMGEAADDYLVAHLPEGHMKNYIRMRIAKAHTPKPVPVEEIAPAPAIRPFVRTQTALPSIAKNGTYQPSSTKQISSSTPDECLAEARNIIIETVEAKGEMPLPALAVLTGLKDDDLTHFIEGVLADYVQVKHIDPLVRPAAVAKAASAVKRPYKKRSPETQAKCIAATKAYWERKRAEKSGVAQ